MRFLKYITIFIFISTAFFNCKDTNSVIKPGDKPVIEAYIAPGQPITMKVFTEIPYIETDSSYSKPISGLKINIITSSGKTFMLNSEGEGLYSSSKTDKTGPAGTTVSMSFSYNGRTIAATTAMPIKPKGFAMDVKEIERVARDFTAGPQMGGGPGGFGGGIQEARIPINLTWTNPDNVYHFVAAQSLEANPVPVIVLPTNGNFDNRPRRRFNNQPIQTTASSLQSQSFEYFGKYAIILYRLNPDYAALYVNNNTTSQNISTPQSTISNGLGIFTGVNADTLVLNVKKVL
jgi:Domain of unknown function (DUF4249)